MWEKDGGGREGGREGREGGREGGKQSRKERVMKGEIARKELASESETTFL